MKTASLSQAVDVMKRGNHCLWAGAGVTIQLVGPAAAPSWNALVEKLELEATLKASPRLTLPRRLTLCRKALGEVKFRQIIRAELHDKMYLRIATIALEEHSQGRSEVPTSIKTLAHLGAIGNPIVSFNIEKATAVALSRPNGSPLLKTYSKSTSHHLPHKIGPERPISLARKVFLVHGCLELFDCVLTDDEYRSHEGSMAFRLATHQAYGSGLFIVGMSLQDRYLLEQIREFRRWLGDIYWVQPGSSKESQETAEDYELTLIDPGSWKDFWKQFERPLDDKLAPAAADLYATWDKLVVDAIEYLGQPQRVLADIEDPTHASLKSLQYLAESIAAGEGRPLPMLSDADQIALLAYSKELKKHYSGSRGV